MKRLLMFLLVVSLLSACQMSEAEELSSGEKLKKVVQSLDKEYNIRTATIDDKRNIIEVDVPNSKSSKSMQKEFKKIAKTYNLENFRLEINKIDLEKAEKQRKWLEVTSALYEKIKNDSQLKGVLINDYDIKVQPQAYIKLYIPYSSSNSSASSYATNVKKKVQEFLTTDNMQKIIKQEPYKLEIYSNDEKLLQS
ncbi:DUF4030 domain-containing protein [Priestia megaterium]|uniref:DUF4030 domain-containing protein n=1 Tax=Priestia megaterium TaxID=1404 RepID=UPI00164A0220|nr:DUF4030 domain-containing protein [Priestia megaterium]